jgi:hypothetical protein
MIARNNCGSTKDKPAWAETYRRVGDEAMRRWGVGVVEYCCTAGVLQWCSLSFSSPSSPFRLAFSVQRSAFGGAVRTSVTLMGQDIDNTVTL